MQTNETAEGLEGKQRDATLTIVNLKTAIENLFRKIRCDTQGNTEILGTQGVTDSNMMKYLGIIEQRANEILQLTNGGVYSEREDGRGKRKDDSKDEVMVRPPAYDDLSSEDEDEGDYERPLSRSELTRRTLQGLHAKNMLEGDSPSGGSGRQSGKKRHLRS